MFSSTMFMLVAFLAGALAGPITYQQRDDSTSCARRCPDTTKFNYVPGMTYEFDYNVQTHTAMEGATTERAALGIRAVADIEVLSKCDMALRLRDVKVYRSDPMSSTPMKYVDESGEFRRNLERFPLRFSFQDGIVEELCPVEGEATWALNIKRGLLTAVQNSMDNIQKDQKVKESDVTGECSTDYKVTSRGWYATSIKKTKDLLGCTDRNGYRSSVHAMPYRVPSDIQSLPLMKSTHECEQELDKNGLLKSALIRETHTFRPFSQASSGATTKILQQLNYKTQRSGVITRQDYIRSRAGVVFEHAYGPGNEEQPVRDAEGKLREICRDIAAGIRPETPRLFSELAYTVKNLDIEGLRAVYQQVKQRTLCTDNNERVKKFFLDSLPMASTSASVQFMKEILLNREVTGAQATMWITSLSFIHYPTVEMLEEIKPLLDSPQYIKSAMLPISTMINNYCNHHDSCSEEYAVTNIISSMEKVIGNGCYVRDSNLEATLLALRALGNAGHLERMTTTLSSCFSRQSNPTEVRVTSIQAYRRLPCTTDRSDVMSIYQDSDEDSELRIAAYLTGVECPTEDVLNRIQTTLENEKANQVGSFVWSHLTNLMESSSPHKQTIRRILEDQTLKREFDLETLKYSRNYEGSLFLEKFNTGAMAESNVIFSEKSFLPRSAMLNMTVDLFGNSLNLFELGGRVEGLEYLLETYLGPYSYFGGKGAKQPKSNAKLDHLRGDVWMRMFGNELYYNHFKGTDPMASVKKFNILDMLIEMSNNKDYSFTQSVMILDSSMVIPTSSGMPLNLTVNGTATIDLQASGQVDLRKLYTSPKSMLIDGMIKPSGAIQIAGTMSMDAFVTKTGLRVVNTWHSSTALKGRVELNRGKILSAELDFPQKKMEILDVTTAFFGIHGDQEKKQELLTENRKTLELCTGSRLATITGLELCNEFQWTNASMKADAPYFPFTGPFSQSLILYKRDTHTGYKLMAKRTMSADSIAAQLAFNTPGSRTDRSLAFDFVLDTKQKDIEINLLSPWKKAELKGSVAYNSKKVGMAGNLIVDGSEEYGIISEVGIKKAKNLVTYIPRLEVRRPGVKVIILSGQVTLDSVKRANVELSLSGVKSNAITLKGAMLNTFIERSMKGKLSLEPGQDYNAEVGLLYQDSGKKKAIIKIIPTLMVKTPTLELISITGSGDYREGKSLKGSFAIDMYKVLDKPISVKCDLKRTTGSKDKYSGYVMINSKVLVSKISGNVQKKKNTMSSLFTLDYNFPKIRSIKKDKVTFSSKYTDRSTKSIWNYQLNTNFQDKRFPEVNFFTDIDLTHNNKHTEADISLTYGPKSKTSKRRFTAYALVNHVIDSKAKIDYKMRTEIGPLDVNLNLRGKHVNDRRSLDSSMTFGYGKGKSIDASLKLKNSGRRSINVMGEAILSYPGKYLNLKTDLVQAKKDYTHSMTIKVDKDKSTLVTTYMRPKEAVHQISSDINMHFMKPLKLSAMTDLDVKDFKASAQADYSGDVYRANTSYKYSKNPNGKWTLDVAYPTRHITVQLDGGKRGVIYEGTADAKWDADRDITKRFLLTGKLNLKSPGSFASTVSMKYPMRDLEFNIKHATGKQYTTRADFTWEPEKKIQVDTSFRNDKTLRSNSLDASLRIRTPFEGYEELFAQATSDNNEKKYDTSAQIALSGKKNQITTALSIKKPYSLRNLDLTVSGTSPFKGYRRMSVEVSHIFTASLNTIIKGNLEGKNAKLTMTGENLSTDQKRDIEGNLDLKTSFKGLKAVSLRVSHKDDLRKFLTDATMNIGGDQYVYALDMNHGRSGWQFQNNGKFTLTSPRYRLVNNWQHRNTANDMKSTLTSEWGRDRRIFINIFGSHDSSARTKAMGGLTVETPWEPVRKIDLNLDHEHGRGFIRHTSSIKQGDEITGSTGLNYVRTTGQADMDFTLASPFTDLRGKTNIRYNAYPYSSHAEIEWSPYRKISMDGSFSAPTIEDIDTNLRFTSPFDNFRDIMLRASHKKEGSDLVSRGSLNYDIRKSLEFESHINTANLNKFTATVKTPFHYYKSVEAGVEYRGNLRNFDSKANFGVVPVLGNFAGIMNWNLNSGMTGKMRIDTPFDDFQYVQVFASSEQTGKGRRSRIETEYYPRKTISIDSTYTFDVPLVIDATLKTPFENMEHMSASVKHAMRRNSLQTHAEVTYGSTKTLGGDLTLKWAKGLTGSMVVNTPFIGYEMNKLSVRHEGMWDQFKSHGEIEFARKTGEADLEFEHGFKTSGSFSLKTPFSGMEETKGTLNKRGTWDNLRGEMTLSYGQSQTIDISVQNRITRRSLDTTLIVKSPFSDDIRITIDHDGQFQNFATKASGTVGSRHSINSETKFTWRYPLVDLSTNLHYTIDWRGKNMGLKLHKDGYVDDMTAKVTGTLDNAQIDISGMFKNKASIEGIFTINTPFTGYEDVGMSLRHSGNLQRFSTEGNVRYMDGKALEGTVTLMQSGLAYIDTTAEIKTPFPSFEYKLKYRHSIGGAKSTSNAVLIYGSSQTISSDISFQTSPQVSFDMQVKTPFRKLENNRVVATHDGPIDNCQSHLEIELLETTLTADSTFEHGLSTRGSLSVISNIEGLELVKASLTKDGGIENFRGSASASLKDSTIEAGINGRIADEIKGTVTLRTPFRNFRDTAIVIDHSGNWNSFKSEGIIRYMDGKAIEGKITVNHNGYKQIKATAQFKTPFEHYEMMTTEYGHTLRKNYVQSNSAITYGYGKRITSDITADAIRNININAVVKTPFSGHEQSKIIFTTTGPLRNFNSHSEAEFANIRLAADTSFAREMATKGNIVITTNIPGYENMKGTFNIEGDLLDLKTSALLNLKDSTLEADLSARLRNTIQVAMNIKTPFNSFRNVGGSLVHVGSLARFNSEGSIRYMDGKVIEGKVVVSGTGERRTMNAELKTPFQGFENQAIDYRFTTNSNRHNSNLEITYGQNQNIIMTVDSMITPTIDISAVLKTPFENFESSRIGFTHDGPFSNYKSHFEMQAIGKSVTADSEAGTSGSSVKGNLNILTNFEGFENMRLTVGKEGDINNLKVFGSLSLRGSTAEASLSNVLTTRRLFTEVSVKNPYTQDIKFQLDFNGRPTSFKNRVSASMGPDTGISTDTTIRIRSQNIDISTGYDFKLAGTGQSGSIKFHKEGDLNNMKMNLNGEYSGKKARMDVEFRAQDDIHGHIKVSTPFRNHRNLGMSFDHSGMLNRFTSEAMIKYMDRKEITTKISHFNNYLERIETSIEVDTPIFGYEFTKAEIHHTASTNGINCNAGVQYGRGNKITAELHGTSSPKYEIDMKATTPFSGYEDLSASSSFDHGVNRYVLESKLNVGNGNRFGLESTLDLSTSPLTAVARLTTPFEEFDSAEITLSHSGELRNFHSTGSIQTPMTGALTGEASLNYRSPVEIDGSVSLSNSMKLVLQNTRRNDKYSSHIEMAWSQGNEITADGTFYLQDVLGETQLMTDFMLRTPFSTLRQTALRFEHHQTSDKYTEKIEADYNGNSVLDMDVEMLRGSRDQGSITMRQPRPMQITLSGEIADKNIDGEMFVNWDRDEPQSNIRVQTTMTDRSQSYLLDKDLTIKLIHPTRTIGIIGNIFHSQQQTKSHGEFIWNGDSGRKIFYDIDLKDRSRRYSKMYDGTMKVGSPSRSVQMDGSYSDTGVTKTVDGSFYWDADRDTTKQVGVKAVFTPGEQNKKADLSLKLPSIGKDIKIDSEMVMNDGRTLFSGKTQLSYSSDSRKTVTLTSRMDDISYGYSNANYSLEFGINHPYTDVDVKVTSHVGSSSEKYSGGMNLVYLTTRRERKNFALRGEINKLRRQIELQMQSPMKNMELSGEVEENPFKLKLRNKYDDKMVRTDLTVDSERRVVDFQTNYDLDYPSKMLHMNAKYVNSSAVQALVFHEVNSRRVSDSLLALRLNTSRLLHTRISWRPQMISDMQAFLTSEVEEYGQKTKGAFHSVYEAVGQELSGKYFRITQAVSEEATPYLALLETETAAIERQLDSVRRDIRRMYRRNDFYMADMGEYFNTAFEAYKDFVGITKEAFSSFNEKLAEYVEKMKTYPIREKYQLLVSETLGNLKRAVDKVVIDSVELISRFDDELQSLRDTYNHHYDKIQKTISESVDNIQNHPKLVNVRLQVSNSYQQYLNSIRRRMNDLNINERYNTIMKQAKDTVTSQLSNVMQREDLQHLISLSNDAYQEGIWAYNYWQVEENLKKHLQSIYEVLKDLVEDEIRQYRDQLVFLEKSRVTVWDPEHGEIQLELYLPVPLESLDTLPDVKPIVQQAKKAVGKYIPKQSTITRYYKAYFPTSLWKSKNTTNRVEVERIVPLNTRPQRRPLKRYNAIPI